MTLFTIIVYLFIIILKANFHKRNIPGYWFFTIFRKNYFKSKKDSCQIEVIRNIAPYIGSWNPPEDANSFANGDRGGTMLELLRDNFRENFVPIFPLQMHTED